MTILKIHQCSYATEEVLAAIETAGYENEDCSFIIDNDDFGISFDAMGHIAFVGREGALALLNSEELDAFKHEIANKVCLHLKLYPKAFYKDLPPVEDNISHFGAF
jgi:hypothetical protein